MMELNMRRPRVALKAEAGQVTRGMTKTATSDRLCSERCVEIHEVSALQMVERIVDGVSAVRLRGMRKMIMTITTIDIFIS